MTILCITEENTFCITLARIISLHTMVGLRLLFSRAHLIHSSSFQSLTGFFFISQLLHISLVIILAKCQPIHHISRIMNLEERLQFTIDNILHVGGEFEMQRFIRDRLQVLGDVIQMLRQKDRSLVERQLHTISILSETTIVSYERTHILCATLHAEQNRTIHDGYILRNIDHRLDISMHRHGDFDLVTFLPLALDTNETILFIAVNGKAYSLHCKVITP